MKKRMMVGRFKEQFIWEKSFPRSGDVTDPGRSRMERVQCPYRDRRAGEIEVGSDRWNDRSLDPGDKID